jgi:hypothetical protein
MIGPNSLYRLCIPLRQALSQLLQLGAPGDPWLDMVCAPGDAPQDASLPRLFVTNTDEADPALLSSDTVWGRGTAHRQLQPVQKSGRILRPCQGWESHRPISERELVWVLGKPPPRLTALLAQLLSTPEGDGVRINPLRGVDGSKVGGKENSILLPSTRAAVSMHVARTFLSNHSNHSWPGRGGEART